MSASVAITAAVSVALTAVFCLGGALIVHRRTTAALRGLAQRLETSNSGTGIAPESASTVTTGQGETPLAQLARQIDLAAATIANVRHRSAKRHPVTGLETRERLLETIANADAPALLGLVELRDFDALCTQSVDDAQAVLRVFADRAVSMTPDSCIIAQIDRARFAIWFDGPDVAVSQASFQAQCYALRSAITTPAIELIPQLGTWSAVVDQGSEPAPAVLIRAISNLAGLRHAAASGRAPDERATGRASFALDQDLRQAVGRHQFDLHYQPFIDAEHMAVCGAEALIRWNHPEEGMISPGVFVPMIERAGLAEEMGLWALDTAIAQAARWRRHHGLQIRIAVNLSAQQLARENFDVVIARMIARHELPAHLLELELTETVAAGDCVAARALFDRLRARQVAISIDDFGTGYSSLNYLKQLDFDKLKIDRAFVENVDRDRQSQAICQSIIALGRGLGIAVLAEGVERFEEYLWLRRHGCRFFQGFYFATPLTADDFLTFTTDRAALVARADCAPQGLRKTIEHTIEQSTGQRVA